MKIQILKDKDGIYKVWLNKTTNQYEVPATVEARRNKVAYHRRDFFHEAQLRKYFSDVELEILDESTPDSDKVARNDISDAELLKQMTPEDQARFGGGSLPPQPVKVDKAGNIQVYNHFSDYLQAAEMQFLKAIQEFVKCKAPKARSIQESFLRGYISGIRALNIELGEKLDSQLDGFLC